MYSIPHIIYVVLFFAILAAVLLVLKYALKTERSRDIFIRSLGGLLAVSLIINRISLTIWDEHGIGAREMIPNTYCGMTSLLLGLCVLFGKPNMKIFHFFVYIELIGGVACIFYPTFINQGPSFFFFPTITGMNHHALGAILCIALMATKRFEPCFKYWYIFPLGICAYTIFGLFLIDALKIFHTMNIDEPVVPGTPLNWWFILIGSVPVSAAVTFCYEKIKNRRVLRLSESNT